MTDDLILSRQAAYIYQYAMGFQPVGNDLTKWRGSVHDSNGKTAELRVDIPNAFPHEPPKVYLSGSTQHPLAAEDGHIYTRSINRWNSSNNVYSVIKEAAQAIKSAPFHEIQQLSTNQEVESLKNQILFLRNQIESKKRELDEVKSQPAPVTAEQHSIQEVIESSLIDIENDLFALEESYDNLDIKAIDFAKEFVELRKRYYLIRDSN